MDTLILFDLGAVFWRCYYATRSDIDAYDLTMEQLITYRDGGATLVVCCDAPPFKRAEMFPEYKAQREEKPREALDSLRAVQEQVDSWTTPVLRCKGYEADDVIATLCAQAGDTLVRIVSQDKDLYALISDTVTLVGKDGRIIDADYCRQKFGVEPRQMVDFLTLTGDAADNIPGCPLVGPGKARDLLQRFDDLNAILKATDEELSSVRGIGQKVLASLREWDPATARQLVTLATDVPVSLHELIAPTPEEATTQPIEIGW